MVFGKMCDAPRVGVQVRRGHVIRALLENVSQEQNQDMAISVSSRDWPRHQCLIVNWDRRRFDLGSFVMEKPQKGSCIPWNYRRYYVVYGLG